ncbi:hypothetical protein CI610_02185 [invertebrate metagenome]|uniref:Uncharacterized protein n=1 Tax=invertebrate metagenome TaxID=1711999 RepID=A0A2H9T6L1_9ZZZZ
MINSLAISDIVLAFASLFAVFLMAQVKQFPALYKTSSIAAFTGFLLMGLASVVGSLHYGISPIWTPYHKILTELAMLLSPPLVAIALSLILCADSWTKRRWFFLIAAIIAFYSISRHFDAGELYCNIQLSILLLFITVQMIRAKIEPMPHVILWSSIIIYFLGGIVIGNEGTLMGYLRLEMFRYIMGLGNLLLGTAMFMVLTKK